MASRLAAGMKCRCVTPKGAGGVDLTTCALYHPACRQRMTCGGTVEIALIALRCLWKVRFSPKKWNSAVAVDASALAPGSDLPIHRAGSAQVAMRRRLMGC